LHLGAPTNLKVSVVSDNELNVSWTAAPGITTFNVLISDYDGRIADAVFMQYSSANNMFSQQLMGSIGM
jgi:hypothetical protein